MKLRKEEILDGITDEVQYLAKNKTKKIKTCVKSNQREKIYHTQ